MKAVSQENDKNFPFNKSVCAEKLIGVEIEQRASDLWSEVEVTSDANCDKKKTV